LFGEHLVYNAAIALLVGVVYLRYTNRNPAWIIVATAFMPDVDVIFEFITTNLMGINSQYAMHHGVFHNLLSMVCISILIAYALSRYNLAAFSDGLICAMIGYTAHLGEDWVVYKYIYQFLFPVTTKFYGTGIIPEAGDISLNIGEFVINLGGITVLLVGVAFLLASMGVFYLIERKGWLDRKPDAEPPKCFIWVKEQLNTICTNLVVMGSGFIRPPAPTGAQKSPSIIHNLTKKERQKIRYRKSNKK
jgi:membrane-bound metal-dependent hydrolase YbcI (DUF457 family)